MDVRLVVALIAAITALVAAVMPRLTLDFRALERLEKIDSILESTTVEGLRRRMLTEARDALVERVARKELRPSFLYDSIAMLLCFTGIVVLIIVIWPVVADIFHGKPVEGPDLAATILFAGFLLTLGPFSIYLSFVAIATRAGSWKQQVLRMQKVVDGEMVKNQPRRGWRSRRRMRS